jgi:hypothetical protein
MKIGKNKNQIYLRDSASLFQHMTPNIVWKIRLNVHAASIANHHCFFSAVLSDFNNVVLKRTLHIQKGRFGRN